jgi:hypothetical protein
MPKSKKNKKGPQLNRGPFSYKEFDRELRRIGYANVKPGDHFNLKHPDRSGKVQLDAKWKHVKVGGWVWRQLCRQSCFSKLELQRILNGLDP